MATNDPLGTVQRMFAAFRAVKRDTSRDRNVYGAVRSRELKRTRMSS